MKSKSEIVAKIKTLRISRNDAKRYENTENFVNLNNAAIKALEWVLGYKRKPTWWCFRCAILHEGLKCPQCGSEKEHEVEGLDENIR